MEIPHFWLKRPDFHITSVQHDQLEAKLSEILKQPERVESPPGMAKWQFLCWLAKHELLLHGSPNSDIRLFEPRTPNAKDDDAFSQQKAVFASSDGILPMFYALLDRKKISMRILNGCLQFELPDGTLSEQRYYFSITREVLAQNPFSEGTVYILPKQGFVLQPPYKLGDWTVHDPHWACLEPVRPLTKLRVYPEDFPFLKDVHGHDDDLVMARAKSNPAGFPWLD